MRLANCVKRVRGANGLSGGTRQHGLLPVSTYQTSLHPRPYKYVNIDRWTIALCPVELLQCVPNFWQGQLRTNHLASDNSSRFHCERECVGLHTRMCRTTGRQRGLLARRRSCLFVRAALVAMPPAPVPTRCAIIWVRPGALDRAARTRTNPRWFALPPSVAWHRPNPSFVPPDPANHSVVHQATPSPNGPASSIFPRSSEHHTCPMISPLQPNDRSPSRRFTRVPVARCICLHIHTSASSALQSCQE